MERNSLVGKEKIFINIYYEAGKNSSRPSPPFHWSKPKQKIRNAEHLMGRGEGHIQSLHVLMAEFHMKF